MLKGFFGIGFVAGGWLRLRKKNTTKEGFYLFIYVFIYVFIYLFIYLFVYLLVYLFIYVFIYLVVYLFIFYIAEAWLIYTPHTYTVGGYLSFVLLQLCFL